MTRQNLGCGIMLLCLLFTVRVSASPFSNIFVFGDSLSDTGNFAFLFDRFSQPPYDRGFSNGRRAVEVLAKNLGLKADASLYIRPGPLVGTNFAVVVARAGEEGPFDLTAQVSAFLLSQGGAAPSDALYFVLIGGNDVRDARDAPDPIAAAGIIQNAVQTIDTNIRMLVDQGAQAILVINAPDIGSIPETRLLAEALHDPRLIERATAYSRQFNHKLALRLHRIERQLHRDLVAFDLFHFFRSVLRNNIALGFTNDTDGCFSSLTFTFNPACDGGANFRTFVFFDEIHPTARTHARAGRAFFSLVPEFADP